MGKDKVYKLTSDMKDVTGREFRTPERDGEGNTIREPVLDSAGKQIMQIPRNAKGEAIPNCQPEPVYRLRTKALGKDTFPEILKGLYLNIPPDKLTRQDTIYGTRLFQAIAASKNGVLTIPDDVHGWIGEKLKDENIGLKIFGVDLYVVEQAADDFDRLHEKAGGKHGDGPK